MCACIIHGVLTSFAVDMYFMKNVSAKLNLNFVNFVK